MKSLESYIVEELNVRDLVLSSDEEKYNVQYSVSADWPTLGKKLKKDAQKVKKSLPSLTSEDVKKFVAEKRIVVDGIELAEEDLIVKRGIKEDETSQNMETNSDSDVLTILDVNVYPELADEGIGREIISRVQRLRKKAGLQTTDDVKMEYKVLSDPEEIGLAKVFQTQSAAFEKTLRRPIDHHVITQVAGEIPKEAEPGLIVEEEQEVQKATFLLRLLKL